MTTYKVTTGSDIVDANDGLVSLREAVASAQAHAGTDTIRFVIDDINENIELTSSIKIAAGNNLTIDGFVSGLYGNVTMDGDYGGNPFTTDGFTMVEVSSGATVTLANMTFANGFERGKAGSGGTSGTDGLKGNDGKGDTGLPGSNGNGGTSGASATSAGMMAVAGVQNAGNLTLDRIDFLAMNAFGGGGGIGGNGGNGGAGGKGAPNKAGVGGGGGAGGPAGGGGNGTDGGDAVGAIYNTGTLKLLDVTIASSVAYGGAGGSGGKGGQGGAGSAGGSSTGSMVHGGYGGYGGNGGNSGAWGDGGNAASAILNAGTIITSAKLATFSGLDAAGTSSAQAGGGAGGGGQGGKGDPRGDNGLSGTSGSAGAAGKAGTAADATHILGGHGAVAFATNTHVVELLSTEVEEGGLLQFAVRRLGNLSASASVDWTISGADVSDFKTGQALAGKASFAAGENRVFFTVYAAKDGIVEGDETFQIDLKNASAGTALGAHKTVTATIHDENQPPTSLSLSKATVDVDAAVDTKIGTLAGSDPDGDTLTFSLLSNPGGYFKLTGSELSLAKTLDPEKHSYSIYMQADDGHGGSYATSLTIRLAGYVDGSNTGETLNGSSAVDHIFGYGGADTLYGFANADFLFGGNGADKLDGGTGADRMTGGLDGDVYIVDDPGDGVFEANEAGIDMVLSSVTYSLSGWLAGQYIENLTLTGNAAIGATGNGLGNTITGNAAANAIDGGKGNDIIDGGGGADTMTGGEGSDLFYVDAASDRVIEASNGGTDTVKTAVSYVLGVGAYVESLQTTAQSGAGAIDLTGNNLGQVIIGNAGANKIGGLGGNDMIFGLEGNDVLTGGTGADVFFFNTILNAASNLDTIADFNVVDDTIRLVHTTFTTLGLGALPAAAFWSSTAGTAHDDSDRVVYDTDSGGLFYDADGNGAGAAIQFATVGIDLALTSADFAIS